MSGDIELSPVQSRLDLLSTCVAVLDECGAVGFDGQKFLIATNDSVNTNDTTIDQQQSDKQKEFIERLMTHLSNIASLAQGHWAQRDPSGKLVDGVVSNGEDFSQFQKDVRAQLNAIIEFARNAGVNHKKVDQEFIPALNKFTRSILLSFHSLSDERALSQEMRDALLQGREGYKLLNHQHNRGVHAEMKVLDETMNSSILPRLSQSPLPRGTQIQPLSVYISVSKACCDACMTVIAAVNKACQRYHLGAHPIRVKAGHGHSFAAKMPAFLDIASNFVQNNESRRQFLHDIKQDVLKNFFDINHNDTEESKEKKIRDKYKQISGKEATETIKHNNLIWHVFNIPHNANEVSRVSQQHTRSRSPAIGLFHGLEPESVALTPNVVEGKCNDIEREVKIILTSSNHVDSQKAYQGILDRLSRLEKQTAPYDNRDKLRIISRINSMSPLHY
ncbi:hypothetical protein EDM53_04650 [Rickettsiales endosymbiont of Peranema trichophorum]|uniref:hypothetical protein n=1 Tax=Rickettsiales endosymbiont of Peranema trichophorum TaxID=2486577 RepID=UPI001022FD92|nr:hypothetical protein [Rickettsiales endosymbiont of Peranema trichophorum]RZI45782.1 hypothetical protein EDM53_04650 [Rickettsiales endosymbiont of Peranema trichophorum]